MNVLCSAEPCPIILNATCVHYEGGNLVYTGINTNDSLETALIKLNDALQNIIITGGGVAYVSVSSGTGISASVTNPTSTPNITITNTAPDQTVVLTAGSGISVTGTYPNFTIAATGSLPSQTGNAGKFLTTNGTVASWATLPPSGVSAVTATAPLASSGGATPDISITQANGSTDGYLSSADWTTFNSKIGGSGTPNYVPKWSGSSALGNSGIYETAGGLVGIGTTTPETNLHVVGNIKAGTKFYVGNSELQDGFISGGAISFKVKTTLGNRPVFLSPENIDILSVNHDLTNGGGLLPIVSVGISDDGNPETGTAFDKSVLLGLTSTTRGFVLPRMTTTQRDAITSPYLGLQVYNTTTNQINYYNGSAWVALSAGSSGTVTSVSAGTGMSFTTITTSGSVAIDTAKVPYFSGNLSGTPSATNFLRGDGAWATPTGSGITSLNGETGASQTFAIGTTGTDFNIASATNVHTFNLPTASGTNTGKLSSADWTTFNSKQAALSGTGIVKSTAGVISYISGTSANFVKGDGSLDSSTYLTTAITSLNGLTGASQTFVNDTNVTMVSAGTTHTITWSGTLADARIASASTWNAKIGGSGTTNEIAYFTGASTLGSLTTATYPSLTELSYVKGVTSGIQTQLNGKQATGSYITALTGDVTATGPGSVAATIANDAVTFAKMQNINTSKLLGRYSASSGDVQEITISTGLSLDGSGNLTASGTSQWTDTSPAGGVYYTGRVIVGTSTDDGANALQVTGTSIFTQEIKETVTLSAQTASYTLAASDRGKLVTMSVGSANNLTVPDNTSVPIPTGTKIDVIQIGAGITTILAAGGVTLLSNNSALRLNGQYAACTLIKVATNTWYVIGNLIN